MAIHVQIHIRLYLEKKSNQGLHCLQFCQYLSLALFYSKTVWFIFCMITALVKESYNFGILQYTFIKTLDLMPHLLISNLLNIQHS